MLNSVKFKINYLKQEILLYYNLRLYNCDEFCILSIYLKMFEQQMTLRGRVFDFKTNKSWSKSLIVELILK